MKKRKPRRWKGRGWVNIKDYAEPPYVFHTKYTKDFIQVSYEIKEIVK